MKGLEVKITVWNKNESPQLQEVVINWPFDIIPQKGMTLNIHKANMMYNGNLITVNLGMIEIESIILHYIGETITYEIQCFR